MAAVRPQELTLRRPPPPAPPSSSPVQATPPPPAAFVTQPQLLPYTRVVDGCWKEGVAESCCSTTEEEANASVVVGLSDDSGCGYDDDGCGSCVDGGEGTTVAWRERGEKECSSSSSACSNLPWLSQDDGISSRSSLWPPPNASRAADRDDHRSAAAERHDVDDDPEATAARRLEEDRKFWEACLASGYP
ncbi:hypothetical protein GUJ93_ZPchr0013g35613 [Zizania palustris]|uniref:Uncharacterized protein n=1 Tax=Zizania palustris TaxID=103762 RepID=A0A8J5WU54_ZIZPA|nr:hypothetical protein GUJ93_ZPchr0013g35613 [Zizania palustris]